jgi:putative PIN family toxin of toxin-antitoxin system
MPLRILVDTNVLISAALFPDGFVSSVLSYLFESHRVVVASYSIDECREVFRRKFPAKVPALEDFLANITYEAFDTPETINALDFPVLRDIADMPVLASAILADVDILITGDKDFSPVKVDRPLIFTPRQYFDLIPH